MTEFVALGGVSCCPLMRSFSQLIADGVGEVCRAAALTIRLDSFRGGSPAGLAKLFVIALRF